MMTRSLMYHIIVGLLPESSNCFDQIVPTYSAYRMNAHAVAGITIRKTTEKYLPSIDSKVCFFGINLAKCIQSTLPSTIQLVTRIWKR